MAQQRGRQRSFCGASALEDVAGSGLSGNNAPLQVEALMTTPPNTVYFTV